MNYNDYNVHWQIDFAALNGDNFRIEICEPGYDGEISHLLGAENPFETEEDNTEDPFLPIRKQTGTLSIADTGKDLEGNDFDYRDIFPTGALDFQVRLWQVGETDTLRWIGFVLDGTLTATLFEAVPIRQYQLTCPLGILYNLPFTFSNNSSNMGTAPTFGTLIYNALNQLGVNWQTVYKTNNVPGRSDLTSRVSLINFVDENKPTISGSDWDYTATWKDTNTFGAVLEEVCLFWGWTLMSRGNDIYILARAQKVRCSHFLFSNLTSTLTSFNEHEYILGDDGVTWKNTEDFAYKSNDHTENTIPGKKKITVNADANVKDSVIKPNLNDLDYDPVLAAGDELIHINNNYRYVKYALAGKYYSMHYFNLENYRLYANKTVITGVDSTIVAMDDVWKWNDDKSSFSMKECVYVWQGNTGNTLSFAAETAEDIIIPADSVIFISASAKPSDDPSSEATFGDNGRKINLGINVGNNSYIGTTSNTPDEDTKKYTYNGNWSTGTQTLVAVLNSGGHIELSRSEVDPYSGSSGYCVPCPTGMCGRLRFQVKTLGGLSGASDPVFQAKLINFEIGVAVHDDVIQPKCEDTQVYEGFANEENREDLEVSLAMASGNKNKYGLGQVFDVNFRQLTGVPYDNGLDRWETVLPEERLLSRLRTVYAGVTTVIMIDVADDLETSLPETRYEVNWRDDEQFSLLAVSHNWRNGTMKITMINR